jgi:ketosteroid isomerase-like protein
MIREMWQMAATASLAGILACAGQGDEQAAAIPEPAVPMPSAADAVLPIMNAYAMAQTAFAHGDVRMYVSVFTDSATLFVPGYGRMAGRNVIARDFAREGQRLGIRNTRRISAGRYIEGRELVDSGTYVIEAEPPFADSTIPSSGRYWTRWRHLPAGIWVIVTDSIADPGGRP